MKKVTDLGMYEAIHCRTEAESDAICKLMHEAGLTWCTGDSYLENKIYEKNGVNTCYQPKVGYYCSVGYYQLTGYTIYPASDFLPTDEATENKQVFWTDEDMIAFADWLAKNYYTLSVPREGKIWVDDVRNQTAYSTEEMLNLWKKQQPKTIHYE